MKTENSAAPVFIPICAGAAPAWGLKWQKEVVSSWSGKPLELPYEKTMKLFAKAAEGRKTWYRDIDEEKAFFRRYYQYLLRGEGVKDKIEDRADLLFGELWCNHDRLLFPETVDVLDYFRGRGFKMGVISDTSPSLEYTLQQLGIAEYFSSFTASSLVGASKPSPVIFGAALASLGVTAKESIYVDDYPPEADGARALGFTSFLIDRKAENAGEWTVTSLRDLIGFVESIEKQEMERNG